MGTTQRKGNSQSPQARWSRKKKRQGRCARCGAPREHYSQLCDTHQKAFAAYMKAWRAARKAAAETATPTQGA